MNINYDNVYSKAEMEKKGKYYALNYKKEVLKADQTPPGIPVICGFYFVESALKTREEAM